MAEQAKDTYSDSKLFSGPWGVSICSVYYDHCRIDRENES